MKPRREENQEPRELVSLLRRVKISEKELQEASRNCTKIESDGRAVDLYLGFCFQFTISSQIRQQPIITTLSLFGCKQLEVLPEQIGKLSNLEKLDLGKCNSLKDIPCEIGRLSHLKILELHHCQSLKELPEELGNLCSLKELNLFGCKQLCSLPEAMGRLSQLVELDVRFCEQLVVLPLGIGCLHRLCYLNTFGCDRLVVPPPELRHDDEIIPFMRDLQRWHDSPFRKENQVYQRLFHAAARQPAFSSSLLTEILYRDKWLETFLSDMTNSRSLSFQSQTRMSLSKLACEDPSRSQ